MGCLRITTSFNSEVGRAAGGKVVATCLEINAIFSMIHKKQGELLKREVNLT